MTETTIADVRAALAYVETAKPGHDKDRAHRCLSSSGEDIARFAIVQDEQIRALTVQLQQEREGREKLELALSWYAVQAAGCRKVTSGGNEARRLLDCDGGQRARAALAQTEATP